MSAGLLIKIVPWGLFIVFFWLWQECREDLAESKERCNREKVEAIAAAERSAREAIATAHENEIKELERLINLERDARLAADEARRAAEARPPRIKEVIKEVANANPESCLNQPIPERILDELRQ